MAAYIIASIEVTDPALYEEYRKQVGAIVLAHGGRFLVRGGRHEVLEGDWNPVRLVVLEFPDMARARAFYDSGDYTRARAVRQLASRGSLVMVEGA